MARRKQTILIDFDGTLSQYTGWRGLDQVGPPFEHARHGCLLLAKEFRLVCFTTRNAVIVEKWLKAYGFPEMKVTNVKEPAFLILDDRAITFEGEWSDGLLEKMRRFRPHWKSSDQEREDAR